VRLPNDGQFDDAAVETLVEDDRLTAGRGCKRRAKGDHPLGRLRHVFETVDYDGFMVDRVTADGEESHENSREKAKGSSHFGSLCTYRGTRLPASQTSMPSSIE
jgi:hypothetical protein